MSHGSTAGRRPVEEPDPDGDDLRGGDDLHRPDDRVDRRAARSSTTWACQAAACSGRSTPTCWRWRRCSRSAGGWPTRRAPQDGGARRDHFRGRVGAVRRHARGSAAEAWLVAFRALQGAGGAIMFPAAIAIVVATFELRSRGRALALFFGIAGGLTAIGPIAGRLPDRVDLAGDLLDQHPGRPDRAGADRHLQAAERVPAGADGLPRPGADRRRRRAERVRVPAVGRCGAGATPPSG